MSWIAERKTTRREDIAYALMGLFDVNMPLLYGEGEKKAFQRLQAEIIKFSTDESIFAWTNQGLWSSGMLASCPSDFADSGNVVAPRSRSRFRPPYQLTNLGFEIRADILSTDQEQRRQGSFREVIAPLACQDQYGPLALNLLIIDSFDASLQANGTVFMATRTGIDKLLKWDGPEDSQQINYDQLIYVVAGGIGMKKIIVEDIIMDVTGISI